MRTAGQVIKHHLEQVGITQRQLANELEFRRVSSALLLGEVQSPPNVWRELLTHLKLDPRGNGVVSGAHLTPTDLFRGSFSQKPRSWQ